MVRKSVKRVSAAAAATGVLAGALVAAGFSGAGAATAPARPGPDMISTVAGGAGGPDPAPNVAVNPCGVRYIAGSLYVGTGDAVRRINPATDWLTSLAGDNAIGAFPGVAGVKATRASISGACDVSADSHGNILFASGSGTAVDVVAKSAGTFYGQKMTAGRLYQIAEFPSGLEFYGLIGDIEPDVAGNLLVTLNGTIDCRDCDPGGAQVVVIAGHSGTFYGQKMTEGHRYVIAGEAVQTNTPYNGEIAAQAWLGSYIGDLRVDRAGNLVIADPSALTGFIAEGSPGSLVRVIAEKSGTFYGLKMRPGRIYDIAGDWKLSGHGGDGVPATKAGLYAADSVTLDSHGNVVISDWGQIRVAAVQNGTFYGKKMRAGYIYTIAGTIEPSSINSPVYSGNGGRALKAVFASESVAVDASGNVVIAGNDHQVVVVADKTGRFYGKKMRAGYIYSVAGNGTRDHSGDGGAATSAELNAAGVAYDRVDGVTLICDISGSAFSSASIRAVSSRTGTFFGQKMTAGDIYTIAAGGKVLGARSGVPATSAGFYATIGTQPAVTPAGTIIVPQAGFNMVQVVAAKTGTFYGQHMKTGYIYTIAGDGKPGYAGDGGPATKAELNGSYSAAVDSAGNILLADLARVRVIAARTGTFYGVTMTAGDIYTIAGNGSQASTGDGGPALAASVAPSEVALDGAGNVLISDSRNGRVRLLAVRKGTFYGVPMAADDIYTIAGDGQSGTFASGSPATAVPLEGNLQSAVDPAGNVILNNEVTVLAVAVKTGTFYGMKMTAGDIYIIGGNDAGTWVFGDGGQATKAFLNVNGLALTQAGNVLIADRLNFRIRSIAG